MGYTKLCSCSISEFFRRQKQVSESEVSRSKLSHRIICEGWIELDFSGSVTVWWKSSTSSTRRSFHNFSCLFLRGVFCENLLHFWGVCLGVFPFCPVTHTLPRLTPKSCSSFRRLECKISKEESLTSFMNLTFRVEDETCFSRFF